jgi:sugar (pentulose or hexulose) kinase
VTVPTGDVTVGIDIGTTSVKALAVDGGGQVLARARVVHPVRTPEPDQLQHDPDVAWRAGVLDAYTHVRSQLRLSAGDVPVAAVEVAAMVPSLCAVDGEARSSAAARSTRSPSNSWPGPTTWATCSSSWGPP